MSTPPSSRRPSNQSPSPKASKQTRHRKERYLPGKPQINPVKEVDTRQNNPQAEADAFRDKRLLKDLQDNSNRSDLTKYRREISATKEDQEEEDDEQENGLVQFEQEAETIDGEIPERAVITDK